MNLDELRAVRRKERQKDSLQHLRDSFYTDVADYIQSLKTQRREAAETADDPFSSPEVSRLTDEIETAEEVVEAIYERRVGKVVKLSSFAAADMSADEEGLTAEERALFDDLVGRIKRNRSTVLDILGGEGPSASSASSASPDADDATGADAAANEGTAANADGDSDSAPDTGTGPGVDVDVNPGAPDGAPSAAPPETPHDDDSDVLADAMGAGAAPDPESADAPQADEGSPAVGGDGSGDADADADEDAAAAGDADRTTVRLTRDVGRILGVDEREYELADEDVVTLPTPNAEPLIERDAAERIE